MTSIRSDLPPLPERMKTLPVDIRGYPVPWFVAWVDGEPKFQVADHDKWRIAVKQNKCWLCGKAMGVHKAFVVGPMCGVNRVSSEPPSHRECAEFAVKGCPFMTRPAAKRSERGLDGIDTQHPGGIMIQRNPGISLLWMTKSYRIVRTPTGPIIHFGDPTEVHFYREGRNATRDEIEHSVETGLPLLERMAVRDGDRALLQLSRQVEHFWEIVARAEAA